MKQRTSISKSETRKLSITLLYIAVITGIIIGSCYFAASDKNFVKKNIITQFILPTDLNSSVFDFFKLSALSYGAFIFAFFALGFFSFGQLLSVTILIYRGFGIGTVLSSLYADMGAKALPAIFILAVPKIVVTTVIIVLASRESIRLSTKLCSYLFKECAEDNTRQQIRLYCIKFIILSGFLLLIAVADSAVNYFFIDLCF